MKFVGARICFKSIFMNHKIAYDSIMKKHPPF